MVLLTEMFSITVLMVTNLQAVITEAKANIQRQKRRKKGKPSPGSELQVSKIRTNHPKNEESSDAFVLLCVTSK